jgi:hypothetical protein
VKLGGTRLNRAGGRSGGRSIGFRLKAETRGFNKIERRMHSLSKLDRDIDAALKCKATEGTLHGKRSTELISRRGWENARLWVEHRENGRNPFIYSPQHGVDIFRQGANDVIHQRKDTMRHALKRVADYMLDVVQRRVAGEVGMKPLAEKYRKWKVKYYYGRPILMLTGQLMRSLEPVVVTMGTRR